MYCRSLGWLFNDAAWQGRAHCLATGLCLMLQSKFLASICTAWCKNYTRCFAQRKLGLSINKMGQATE